MKKTAKERRDEYLAVNIANLMQKTAAEEKRYTPEQILNAGYLAGYMQKEAAPAPGTAGKTNSSVVNDTTARINKAAPAGPLKQSLFNQMPKQPSAGVGKTNPNLWQAQKHLLSDYVGRNYKNTPTNVAVPAMRNALQAKTRPAQANALLDAESRITGSGRSRDDVISHKRDVLPIVKQYDVHRTKGQLSPDQALEAMPTKGSRNVIKDMIGSGFITAQNKQPATGTVS